MADEETTYGLEALVDDVHFMAEGKAVHLASAGDVFKTHDRRSYEALRALPFLHDVGELDADKPKASELIAGVGDATEDELNALVGDPRKTVSAAAAAELERRAGGAE